MYFLVATDRASKRYLALIEQLADESGRAWGWKSKVAKRLGVTQPFVSLVINGDRGVGREAIEKAVESLSVDPSFFFGDKPGHYPRFVRRTGASSIRPELAAYRATWEKNTK